MMLGVIVLIFTYCVTAYLVYCRRKLVDDIEFVYGAPEAMSELRELNCSVNSMLLTLGIILGIGVETLRSYLWS